MACVVEAIRRVVPQHRLAHRVDDDDSITDGIERLGESPPVEIGLGRFTSLVGDERAPATAHLLASEAATSDRSVPAPVIRTGR